MLAYAANRPIVADRKPAPNTMLVIIGVHVAAIAALMSAKMELPPRPFDPPTIIDFIHPKPPPPPSDPVRTRAQPTKLAAVDPQTKVPPVDQSCAFRYERLCGTCGGGDGDGGPAAA